jgi:hypothetical protein
MTDHYEFVTGRAADATHLATAVGVGADRFITNDQRDFPTATTEVHITYPADLPGPATEKSLPCLLARSDVGNRAIRRLAHDRPVE